MTSASDRRAHRRALRAHSFSAFALRIALGMATVAGVAYAAEPDVETRTVARELARRGADAFEQKDYKTALDRFERAETLFRVPSIGVMRARSLAALGRLVEALDAYEATARMPLASDAPAAFREAVDDAKREGEELHRRIPHLTLHVRKDAGVGSALTVTLDGKSVPEAMLDVERPVDPGRHEVKAWSPEHEPVTQSARVNEGDHLTLDMGLGNAPALAPVSKVAMSDGAAEKANDARSSSGTPVLGWALLGAGTAGLGIGAVTGTIALSKKSSLDSVCHPGCPSSASSDLDAFRSNRTISYVSLALGAVAAGTGGYLLLFTHRNEGGQVAAAIGPGSVQIRGAF